MRVSGERPEERIEDRNQKIEDVLDQSLEEMRMVLEGPKSEEISEQERIAAQRIVNGGGKEEPIFKEMVQRQGDKVPELESENYMDYWRTVNNHLDADESARGLYLMAGEDWTPALEIEGNWTFLGLDYQDGSTEVAGEDIDLVNQDISEGVGFSEEFDYAVVKSPGAGNVDGSLGELGVDRAYEALKEDGVLITDQDYDGEFRPEGSVEPAPKSYLRRISTEHGAAYNPGQLRILRK